ncbi:radical SAM/SPASM domain-containing protein [Treponema putidum]|uniref:radical SAM/SPASM domain-containing protein n=1 Tax=Treponema putidum TaxID=221027 RepID=UPI003D94A800
MKAKIKPRIDLINRTRLEEVIPLRTPFIINIDPSDKCNFLCKFCPTGDRELMKKTPGRNHGPMDFELYKKIINDICTFEDKVKVIRLYKDGEPLMNRYFPDMIRYAKESGCCDRVDTTSNAALLNHDLSLKIIDAGLDRINISIEGMTNEQYMEFSGARIDLKKLINEIAFFYEHSRNKCEMIVKINGDTITEEQKQEFLATFGDIADGVFIESIMDCWPTFDIEKVEVNETRGIYAQKIKEVMVCPYVFYSIAVNSNGTISLCFLDWHRKLVIGNALMESIKDIWNGDTMKNYQKMFLRKERKTHPICSDCGQLKQGAPDDIDAFADELLSKLL